jgi:D-3-phosphoglycerate dehydrogenase
MNKKYQILNAEPDGYSKKARGILDSFGLLTERQFTRSELIDCIGDYEVLIVRLGFQIDREIIQHSKKLKVIVTATTGTDHIDLALAADSGIKVLCLKGEVDFLRSIPATAELTWGLIIALVRNLPSAVRSVQEKVWDRESFRGFDLSGKTLGILGLGRIGEKVAGYGLAFGMRVIAFDTDENKNVPGVKMMESLEDLLLETQILSIHLPLNSSTEGLINEQAIAVLTDGAWIINTSRGDILDEVALLNALKTKKIAGAALDVIQNERSIHLYDSAVINYAIEHANLIITPHIGGATYDSMAATEIFMAKKLKKYLEKTKG